MTRKLCIFDKLPCRETSLSHYREFLHVHTPVPKPDCIHDSKPCNETSPEHFLNYFHSKTPDPFKHVLCKNDGSCKCTDAQHFKMYYHIKTPSPTLAAILGVKTTGYFGKVETLYHATSKESSELIIKSQHFNLSTHGETGDGIYFASKAEDAIKKGSRSGKLPRNYVVVCKVLVNMSYNLTGAFANPKLTQDQVLNFSCGSVHVTQHPTGEEWCLYDNSYIKIAGCLAPPPSGPLKHEKKIHTDGREICWFDHVCTSTDPGHYQKYAHPRGQLLHPVCPPPYTDPHCKVLCRDDERCTNNTGDHSRTYQHPRRNYLRSGGDGRLCPHDEWCTIQDPAHFAKFLHLRLDVKKREFSVGHSG